MRARLENWLLRHWYGEAAPPWYLRMLEPAYRFASQGSQQSMSGGSENKRPAVPLVIVGNLTAGGSGKTPLVIALCRMATEMGLKAGIISKGHGRTSRDTLVVEADSSVDACGDEPVLLSQRTGLPVVVACEREEAVERLKQLGVELVFSDDGLQQVDLPRSLEICVVDGVRGLGNGHLIPAGPLREPAERLFQVDHVVTNGEWTGKPATLHVTEMSLQADCVRSLDGKHVVSVEQFLKRLAGKPVQAVAGIGNPMRFFSMLEAFGFNVAGHQFADHHAFRARDFASIKAKGPLVMTEKDAVKCRNLGLQDAWYVPVETHLPGAFESALKHQLSTLVNVKG